MNNGKIVKCKYSNCLHEKRELMMGEAVKSGSSYYHPDCYKTKENIKQIIDLFRNHINANPVYSQLQSVIKNIIFTKGLESDFLLFGLQYYINKKIPLNYPQGLYYVIQNKDVLDAYNKEKVKTVRQKVEIKQDNDFEFKHTPRNSTSFADILKQ